MSSSDYLGGLSDNPVVMISFVMLYAYGLNSIFIFLPK